MRKRWRSILLAAVILQIPFETRYELLGLSNLQWTFVALLVVSVSDVVKNWKSLLKQRLVQAALLFVSIQWLAALFAPEFHTNAVRAAARFSVGFLLLVIALVTNRRSSLLTPAWIIASSAAAIYALLSYVGVGIPWLFRTEEFYIGQVQRLSASFEYPNTAAAYFAMSLPVVWWSRFRPWMRWGVAFLLWCALVLTFSKGALFAVLVAVTAGLAVASSMRSEWRSAVLLLTIGIAAYGVLLPLNPYLIEQLYAPDMRYRLSAEYGTTWNKLTQQPGTEDQIPIHIRNTGITKWRARGLWRTAVAYRWWDIETETFVATTPVTTPLLRDVVRGDTIDVVVPFRTPNAPGKYLLVVELFSRNYDWFSRMGVVPALVRVDVAPGVSRSVDSVDLSAFYGRRQMPSVSTASVPRSTLWLAALKMFSQHPFGVGPDNYRLEYGKYIPAVRWDTHVYSNNLFLEVLTGSGILGLVGLGLLLLAIPWKFDPPCLGVAIFLVHGLVDVFLMTTPIYFAFWLLLGCSGHVRTISGDHQ